MADETKAAATPLVELLGCVPEWARLSWEADGAWNQMPIGRYCQEAVQEIDRLRAEVAAMEEMVTAARNLLDPKRWSHLSLRTALAKLDEVRGGDHA